MISRKSKRLKKKDFTVREEVNQHKENPTLKCSAFYSPKEVKQRTLFKKDDKHGLKVNAMKNAVQGDNKLQCVTKVHLERIPLQNLLNCQQKLFSSLSNNLRGGNKIDATVLNKSRDDVKRKACREQNLDLSKTADTKKSKRLIKNSEKSKILENGEIEIELKKKSNKKRLIKPGESSNTNCRPCKSPIKYRNNALTTNKNNTLKTPVYNQCRLEENKKDHEDEYDFIVSPSNTRHKYKKKKKINRTQTPVSFHLFDIPKFTKKDKKARKFKRFPGALQAFLVVNPQKGQITDISKSNTVNNHPTSAFICNNPRNDPKLLSKPLTNLDKVITDIKAKINSKKQEVPTEIQQNDDYDSEEIDNVENDSIVDPSITKHKFPKSDKTVQDEIDTYFGFDCDDKQSPLIEKNIKQKSKSILNTSHVNKSFAVDSTPTSSKVSNNKIAIVSDILIKPSSSPDKTSNESSLSLFETSYTSILNDPRNSTDFLRQTVNDSVSFNNPLKKGPGANSTMIRPFGKEKSVSWRLDDIFQYNPHYLMLKGNSLPATDQESIINHTFDDSICQNTKKSSQNNEDKNPVKEVQKSILDFVESSGKSNIELPKAKRVSLFDVNELSPLKESQQHNLPQKSPGSAKRNIFNRNRPVKNSLSNKENMNIDTKCNISNRNRSEKNSPTNKENINIDKVRFKKRNKENSLITERSSNSPKKNSFSKNLETSAAIEHLSPLVLLTRLDLTVFRKKELNLTNDFGFDSLLIDDEILKKGNKEQAPTRFSIGEIKKVLISNNSDMGVIENSPKKVVHDNDTPIEENIQQAEEFPNDKTNVGLFKDLELDAKPAAKKYERKRTAKRKQRFYSKDSDSEHSVVNVPKRKKKDVMSIEEEEEFEKWAEAFNSECEEVEKFDMEIQQL